MIFMKRNDSIDFIYSVLPSVQTSAIVIRFTWFASLRLSYARNVKLDIFYMMYQNRVILDTHVESWFV